MTRGGDFWSRRKARVEAEEAAEAQAAEEARIVEEHAALEEKSDAELLEEFQLPDPDTLQPGDDIRGFMNKAVPDRLRRRALRKLWRLNPVLANVDGLVDYGEDYTDSATVVENLQTAYQIGKGMLKHVEELARQAEAKALAESAPDAPDFEGATQAAIELPVEDSASDVPITGERVQDAADERAQARDEAPGDPEDTEATETLPTRRRMRFQFDDTTGEHAA